MAPKDNAKKSGDIHPPDVELEPPIRDGVTDDVGASGTPRDRRGKAADETSDSDHNTRESGAGSGGNKSRTPARQRGA